MINHRIHCLLMFNLYKDIHYMLDVCKTTESLHNAAYNLPCCLAMQDHLGKILHVSLSYCLAVHY